MPFRVTRSQTISPFYRTNLYEGTNPYGENSEDFVDNPMPIRLRRPYWRNTGWGVLGPIGGEDGYWDWEDIDTDSNSGFGDNGNQGGFDGGGGVRLGGISNEEAARQERERKEREERERKEREERERKEREKKEVINLNDIEKIIDTYKRKIFDSKDNTYRQLFRRVTSLADLKRKIQERVSNRDQSLKLQKIWELLKEFLPGHIKGKIGKILEGLSNGKKLLDILNDDDDLTKALSGIVALLLDYIDELAYLLDLKALIDLFFSDPTIPKDYNDPEVSAMWRQQRRIAADIRSLLNRINGLEKQIEIIEKLFNENKKGRFRW